MRIFVVYGKDRIPIDVSDSDTVGDVLETVRKRLRMNLSVGRNEKKFLVLSNQGAELMENWVLTDLGFEPGISFKCFLKEEEQPSLRIHLAFSNDTIPIYEKLKMFETTVAETKSIISATVGLPVSAFRLATSNGTQLYDGKSLDDYGIQFGDLITLDTCDGWGPLLYAALMDLPEKVQRLVLGEEDPLIARFMARVALYIAAHHGLTDLANKLVSGLGVRPDIPVGTHPARQWCARDEHVDSFKPPFHVAAERDQMSVLRLFVNHNLCYCVSRDGNNLTALSVALRAGKKKCASLLLTRQWSKVTHGSVTLPLHMFAKVRKWAELAKDEVYLTFGGGDRSSVKIRKWYSKLLVNTSHVGQPVLLEGFSPDLMTSKPTKTVITKSYLSRAQTASQPRLPLVRIQTPPLVRRERTKYLIRKGFISESAFPNILELDKKDAVSKRGRFAAESQKSKTGEGGSRQAKAERPKSVISRLSSRTQDGQILLPASGSGAAAAGSKRPFVTDAHGGGRIADTLTDTVARVERKMGHSLRQQAIDSLNVATSFQGRGWLQQINLANSLSTNALRRRRPQSSSCN